MAETLEAPPPTQEGKGAQNAAASASAAPAKRRGVEPLGWILALLVVAGAAVGGYYGWQYLQSYVDTDDAEIDGDIYSITSRITGTITAVHVQDLSLIHI